MHKIEQWLEALGCHGRLKSISGDASFRRYYRLYETNLKSVVIMDASLQKESLKPFIDITSRLHHANVRVPRIIAQNPDDGVLMLEDMGSRHLIESLNENTCEPLYSKAIDAIIKIQNADTQGLPVYDEAFLYFEMELMQEWYLQKYLHQKIDSADKKMIADTLAYIASEVLAQPQGVFVHRDFHSRNLMLSCEEEIIVIDYQDARVGPITYDLVSLLRDCYVAFDAKTVEKLALSFRDKKGLDADDAVFMRWFDFMGLQRHIKVLGIFSRLSLRDGKNGYLKDIPLTLQYILNIAKKYDQTQALAQLLEKTA